MTGPTVSDPRGSALFVELIAAANHRPALRDAVGEYAREVRKMQMDRLATLLPEYDLDPEELSPSLIAAAIQGLAFGLAADQLAGHDTATADAYDGMSRLVERLEERRRSR